MTENPSNPPGFERVWTIPNAISALRLILIVVFTVFLAVAADGWALGALAVAAVSDFFDGYLARRWNQVTRLGRILDPAADRLLTVAMLVGLALRGVIPWWLAGALLARDVVVGGALLVGKRRGVPAPRVTFAGKAATFGLYAFLPLAYLAWGHWLVLWLVAMAGAIVAATVYWISGLGYVAAVRRGAPGLRWGGTGSTRKGQP